MAFVIMKLPNEDAPVRAARRKKLAPAFHTRSKQKDMRSPQWENSIRRAQKFARVLLLTLNRTVNEKNVP